MKKREKNEKMKPNNNVTNGDSAHLTAWPRVEAPALVYDLCVIFILVLIILIVVAARKPRPLLAFIWKRSEQAGARSCDGR